MSYGRDVFEKVENYLYTLRLKEKEDFEKRKEVFYLRFPRAREIENTLASMSIRIAKSVLKKGSNVKSSLDELKKESTKLKHELSSIIDSAKLPENYLEIHYKCKFCKDEGFIDGKMCKCMKDLLKKESYNRLCDMSPISGCTFRNFSLEYYQNEGSPSPRENMRKNFDYCCDYAKNFSKNSDSLLFMGKTGLGKTHISMAIACEVIHKGGYSVIYTSAHNMVSSIEREKFDSSSGGGSKNRNYFLDCDLLIIDDLGTEFSTSFSGCAIYDIIDSRMIFKKPVIISTNLSVKDFKEKYNDQIVSRILGYYEVLQFFGQDIRPKLRAMRSKI